MFLGSESWFENGKHSEHQPSSRWARTWRTENLPGLPRFELHMLEWPRMGYILRVQADICWDPVPGLTNMMPIFNNFIQCLSFNHLNVCLGSFKFKPAATQLKRVNLHCKPWFFASFEWSYLPTFWFMTLPIKKGPLSLINWGVKAMWSLWARIRQGKIGVFISTNSTNFSSKLILVVGNNPINSLSCIRICKIGCV